MNELESDGKTAEATGEPGKDPKVIKRYTNRKLYDTVESRYVTLDEIAEMIKQGVEVQIVDNRSKEDLTSVTLAQIVFEEEKKKSRMPLSVLREIIRHPGESLQGFIEKEVSPRVASIREEAQDRIDKLLRREEMEGGEGGEAQAGEAQGQSAAGPAELLKASQKALEDWQKRMDERIKHVVENLTGNLPAMGRDLQSLHQKLEEIEKKMEELEKRKKS